MHRAALRPLRTRRLIAAKHRAPRAAKPQVAPVTLASRQMLGTVGALWLSFATTAYGVS